MNRLPEGVRASILSTLVEGASMRATARLHGVSFNTVAKLQQEVGAACLAFHHDVVRGIKAKRLECDEIWAFCHTRPRRRKGRKKHLDAHATGRGDLWTWTAIDPDSKLLITWEVARRDLIAAVAFAQDLRMRVEGRPQITTDGLRSYADALERVFGSEMDYAQVMKHYDNQGHYSGSEKVVIAGDPDPKHISTSLVERMNLTMRMGMRRYTRDTNGHSKRVAQHCLALGLFFTNYNFCRPHMGLDGRTPAMAAGLASKPYSTEWLVRLADSGLVAA